MRAKSLFFTQWASLFMMPTMTCEARKVNFPSCSYFKEQKAQLWKNQATRPSEQCKCLHVLTRNACNSEPDYTFINSAAHCCYEHLQFSLRQPNSTKCSGLHTCTSSDKNGSKKAVLVPGISLCGDNSNFRTCACDIWLGLKTETMLTDGGLSTRLLLMDGDVIQLCINYLARENRELERKLVWSPRLKTVYLAVQLRITWKAEGKRNNLNSQQLYLECAN